MSDLISLAEHNNRRWSLLTDRSKPRKNGIACPLCGEELVDPNPMEEYTSDPPQIKVECLECGYVGMRIA